VRDEPEDVFVRFAMYVGQVWVHEHAPPTDGPDLASFDALSIKPDWDKFLAEGHRLDYQGLTLEEGWLTDQLFLRQEPARSYVPRTGPVPGRAATIPA
jgi:hypothetical protein